MVVKFKEGSLVSYLKAYGRMVFLVSLIVMVAGLPKEREVSAAGDRDLVRTHTGGGVTVKVTYLNPQGPDGPLFQVVLDTHSVDLDGYDLKSLSALRDHAGKVYSPAKAESKGGGHHRQVTLYFPEAVSQAKFLEVVIRDIAGVKERVFRWEF